jgi:hypothetical protein
MTQYYNLIEVLCKYWNLSEDSGDARKGQEKGDVSAHPAGGPLTSKKH